jgi:hypothetical protein
MLEVGDTVMRKFAELFPGEWRELSSAELFRLTIEDEISHNTTNWK